MLDQMLDLLNNSDKYTLSVNLKIKKNIHCLIYISLIINRKQILKKTGIVCLPEHFNKNSKDFKFISKEDKQYLYKNQQIKIAYQLIENSILETIRKYGYFNIDLAKIALQNKYAKVDLLADYANKYIETKQLSKTTQKRYSAILRMNILPQFSNTAIVEVTPRWLSLFHQELIKKNYANTTIWTIFKFLKSVLHLAEESIDFNFPIGSKKGQYKMPPYKNPDRNYLSLEQIEKLKVYNFSTSPQWRNASRWFVLQIYLGCRAGDLQKYNLHQIKDNLFYITDEKTKNQHYVPMYPALQEAINNIEQKIYVYAVYNRLVKEIGMDMQLPFALTTHVARHTFAVSKLNASISSESTMKAMGIKKYSTFAVYGKITDEKLNREFAEKLK